MRKGKQVLTFLILLTALTAATPLSSFVYPLMSTRISSDYGMRIHPIRRFSKKHSGIDLAAPRGAPIRAVAGGTVVFADPHAGYGRLVVVSHQGGRMTTHYAHCHELRVKPGDRINAGQIIATVGSSGLSTAPHLHFEVRFGGMAVDPEKVIPGLAEGAEG